MRALPLVSVSVVALALLTGCAGTVSVTPAEHASDPGCASTILALPRAIGGTPDAPIEVPLERRATDAQASAAWGEPTAVLLRCGVPEPAPSTDPCVTVGEGGGAVDWIVVDQGEGSWRFVTYGRSPATEVVVDTGVLTGATALDAVSAAVATGSEVTAQCLATNDAP